MVAPETYGARDHRPLPDTIKEFVEIVQQSVESGAKILVPTFAVGRAQLILLLLSWMFRTGKSKPIPIFLDSPMAVDVTRVYGKYCNEHNLDDCRSPSGESRIFPKNVFFHRSAEESKKLNQMQGPAIILAGSGMMTGGRILPLEGEAHEGVGVLPAGA